MSNVPDYRAMFLRGYGSQNHSKNNGTIIGVTNTHYASAGLNEIQGDAGRRLSGSVGILDDYSLNPNGNEYNPVSVTGAFYVNHHVSIDWKTQWNRNKGGYVAIDSSRIVPTASENRPVNKAVKYLIWAQ